MRGNLKVRHAWWTFPSTPLDSCVTRCVSLNTFDKCARTPPVLVVQRCAQSPSIVLLAVPKNRPTTAVLFGSVDPDQLEVKRSTACKLACSIVRVRERVQWALQIMHAQVLKHRAYTSSLLPTDMTSNPLLLCIDVACACADLTVRCVVLSSRAGLSTARKKKIKVASKSSQLKLPQQLPAMP